MLAPIKQYDCYISHNGSAAAMTLPTSYNASNPSDSSPAGPGAQQQVLLLTCLGLHTCAAMHPECMYSHGGHESLQCFSLHGTARESSNSPECKVQRTVLSRIAIVWRIERDQTC